VRALFDETERWEMERQARVEAEAAECIRSGDEAEAVALLQLFSNQNCERVQNEYRDLNQTLPKKLTAAGLDYLYVDYLKEWTSGKGVPLPMP
jgi:hypothetical protein